MVKVSMWSSFFSDESPEDAIKIMSEHGYQYTELSDEHAAAILKRGNPEVEGKKFMQYAKSVGMSFLQGHLSLAADIVAPDTAIRRQTIDSLLKWLDLFAELEISAAVLHPGGRNAVEIGWSKEQVNKVRSESLKVLAKHAESRHIIICLENIRHDMETFFEIFENTGVPGLGICFDTGHLNIYGGNPAEFIKRAGKHLKALHITDNRGDKDDHIFPYGTGTIKWKEIMIALNKNGYDGLLNFEVPGERRCPKSIRESKLDYALRLAQIMNKLNAS